MAGADIQAEVHALLVETLDQQNALSKAAQPVTRQQWAERFYNYFYWECLSHFPAEDVPTAMGVFKGEEPLNSDFVRQHYSKLVSVVENVRRMVCFLLKYAPKETEETVNGRLRSTIGAAQKRELE